LRKINNLLEKINFTSKDIERALQRFETIIEKRITRREMEENPELYRIEEGIKPPLFIQSFYKFSITKQKIPSQKEFHSFYLENDENYKFIQTEYLTFTENEKIYFEKRMNRAYVSIIRDLHVSLVLRERKFNVIYNMEIDANYGFDIIIINKNNIRTGFKLRVDTQRSNDYMEKKKRLQKQEKVVDFSIDFVLADKKCRIINKVWLYSEDQIKEMIKISKNGEEDVHKR